jgi:inosose dehydratase
MVQGLRDIKAAGYDAVETLAFTTYNLDFTRRHMEFAEWDEPPGFNSDIQFMSRFAILLRTCRELDLRLTTIFIESEFINPHIAQGEFDQVVTISHLLKSVGASHVLVDGGPRRSGSKRHYTDLVDLAKAMTDLGRITADIGIELCFHPHIDTCVETPEDIEIFFNEADSRFVSLALDTAHVVAGGGDPLKLLRSDPSRVRYVHFKDLADPAKIGEKFAGAGRYQAFRNLGEGVIDFVSIWNTLRQNNYDQPIIVEFDLTENPALSAKLSREYLRTHIGI